RLPGSPLGRLGGVTPKPRYLVEVGAGLGYVAREMAKELLPFERQGIRYVCLDLAKPCLESQLALAEEAGWSSGGMQANAEWWPVRDDSIDLVIDNENLADMTPVQLSREEVASNQGTTPLHQEAVDWI